MSQLAITKHEYTIRSITQMILINIMVQKLGKFCTHSYKSQLKQSDSEIQQNDKALSK